MPLREFSTRYVWGELWSRKDLPLKTRSLINVALLTALKCGHELQTHIRAARNNGCTKAEIREVLLQCGVYAGIPVMRDAIRHAQKVLRRKGRGGVAPESRLRCRRPLVISGRIDEKLLCKQPSPAVPVLFLLRSA